MHKSDILSMTLSSNLGYSGPVGGPCQGCEAGKYKDGSGDSSCIECAAGYYSSG